MRVKTDYMKVKTIEQFIKGLEDARDQLRREAEEDLNFYSGLQADVLEPVILNLKAIIEGKVGK